MRADGPDHFHSGKDRGRPPGLAFEIPTQRRGLGLGGDKLDDRRRIQIDHDCLSLVVAGSCEPKTWRRHATLGRQRRAETEHVAVGEGESTARRELAPAVEASHGDEPRDRAAVRGDLNGLPFFDLPEELAGSLAQLANANRLHVLQSSTLRRRWRDLPN